MTTVLKTNNLSKLYKNQYALKNCSITINKGEIYGIVGKNGAGKSTLLKLISGITYPSEGSIELFGESNLNVQRKRVSSIVENPTLFGDLSAKDNLEYFRIQRGIADKEIIDNLLEEVGLGQVGKKQVKKFSVGMKQRLALALSLMSNPELLILDEPISGIDPSGIVQIRRLLQRLNKEKGVTIIISSHILTELSNLATKIAIIDKGEIKEELSLEDLYNKSSAYIELKTDDPNKAVTILETAFNIKDYEIKADKSIFIYDHVEKIEDLVSGLVKEGVGISMVIKEHKTLEDYYISLTGE